MSKKLPAFQFYPQDWRSDIGVQSLSLNDRMIWFEMLCLMHESEQRGKLILNGEPMHENVVSRLLGIDVKQYKKALANILKSNVATIDNNGVIINRRMVKDDELIQIRREAGLKGGNPKLKNLLKQNSNQSDNQNPTPSSSSSITTSNNSLSSAQEEFLNGDEKKLLNDLCMLWGVNELSNPRTFFDINAFLIGLKKLNQIENFTKQLIAYIEYHALSKSYKHTPQNFMGVAPNFEGAWNEINWEKKLKDYKDANTTATSKGVHAKDTGARKNFNPKQFSI